MGFLFVFYANTTVTDRVSNVDRWVDKNGIEYENIILIQIVWLWINKWLTIIDELELQQKSDQLKLHLSEWL